MITVRFPNGLAVVYNNLHYLTHGDNETWCLWDKSPAEGGTKKVFIQASAGALVEFVTPCTVTAPPVATAKSALELIVNGLESRNIVGWEEERLLVDLKRRLKRFDARRKVWQRSSTRRQR